MKIGLIRRRHLLLAGLLAAALVPSAQALAADTVTLRLANVQPPKLMVQEGLRRLVDLVAERTAHAVEIRIYPAGQLGSEQESLEGVQLGTIDMYEGSAASVGRFLTPLEALACPFLWKSPESMVGVVRGPIGEELSHDLLARRGIHILDLGWIFGVRQLTTRQTPVRTPSDMAGLRIRVQPDPIYLATVRAMGGSPTPIDAQEVYTALQSGIVDGQENPIPNIQQRRFYEVQKYLSLTGHITQNQTVVIGEAAFQRLTPEQRQVLLTAAREAGDFQNGLVAKAEAEDLAKLKAAGMEVIEPDVAAFRAATAGVCRDPAMEERFGKGLYDRLLAAQR